MRPGAALLALLLAATAGAAGAPATDPDTGLVVAPGWERVKAHCGACHSYQLVTAQRGGEAFWINTIRWMQDTQNLWPIPPADQRLIVAYLARHYDESDWGRRPPLPPSLMPTP